MPAYERLQMQIYLCRKPEDKKPPLWKNNLLRVFSPPANYTDRETAACRRS
jgi:hypothetical protein